VRDIPHVVRHRDDRVIVVRAFSLRDSSSVQCAILPRRLGRTFARMAAMT
jgi:hypothetical protein